MQSILASDRSRRVAVPAHSPFSGPTFGKSMLGPSLSRIAVFNLLSPRGRLNQTMDREKLRVNPQRVSRRAAATCRHARGFGNICQQPPRGRGGECLFDRATGEHAPSLNEWLGTLLLLLLLLLLLRKAAGPQRPLSYMNGCVRMYSMCGRVGVQQGWWRRSELQQPSQAGCWELM
jgi:hypothetical protein